ncbi:cell division protein FtsQ/DivIB [Cutibacterium namnetense]|uniref:POTRA domain protein, FtsQ-type n=1 Tax=[Propionibacterium] namnetense SK182B-JCVI TaxID=1051006 RepID=F9NU65_9ACTN|nr:FtsQ-type POTRA domain-containing protein [Cutibacterium namnetense]EGR97643.1 POTRA domain protein, FtsQ-type [ [[Propionibacterium] namnetense SK182B-JCVI]TKW71902.1 MAG: FtsQ-type POTRA domain-containing protein [Cutibacterium acnes]
MPVSDISVAMELRRRRRRKRNRIIAEVVAALVVLILVAIWIVRSSSLLCVDTIEVHGTHLLTASQVEQAAKVVKGQPLARVNTDDVAARVMAMDIVQQAEVHRKWPHTVVIDVTELKISYQVKTPGGYLWIDPSGRIFNRTAKPIPRVVWATTASGNRGLLRDVATVSDSFPSQLRRYVDHIEAKSRDAIVVALSDKRTVVWGSADQSALKAKVTTAMLHIKATRYDVSSPEHPTSR